MRFRVGTLIQAIALIGVGLALDSRASLEGRHPIDRFLSFFGLVIMTSLTLKLIGFDDHWLTRWFGKKQSFFMGRKFGGESSESEP